MVQMSAVVGLVIVQRSRVRDAFAFNLDEFSRISSPAKYAAELGIPGHRSSWMYFAIGTSSLVSRLLTGKLCDTGWIPHLRICQLAVVMFAIDDFLVPLATTFTHLMVYSVVYGISEGLFAIPAHCIMMKSYAGIGFGWYISFQGVSVFISPVLSGISTDHIFISFLQQVFYLIRSARPGEQYTADLPQDRITPNKPPFTYVGADYFGPFEVKQGRSRVKRRFISMRGYPEEIRSDRGTNFVKADKELKEALRELDQPKLSNYCALKEIQWNFNPPSASHMGGAWERMIGSAKYAAELGIPGHRSSWMYFAIGTSALVSRLLTGKLCDTGWIPHLRICQFAVVMFAMDNFLVPLATTFTHLMVYSVVFGISEVDWLVG
ncbi:hypothetical protein QZH41_002363 [Actinostola sp. cb2023]|nr:hypothetical protein QZH41_002363 [Actinostola sp. cb2023]